MKITNYSSSTLTPVRSERGSPLIKNKVVLMTDYFVLCYSISYSRVFLLLQVSMYNDFDGGHRKDSPMLDNIHCTVHTVV